MFESIVADFLSRYLGQYIDGFDPKQLKIGIWKGQIEYHNIKLKVDVLNSFSLPISIKDGAVQSLSLSIPWHNLKGGNIEITLDGIYLLARPAEVAESETVEQEQQRELLNKQARLMRAEMLKATKLQPKSTSSSSSGGGMSQGLLLRLLTTVVDKVQITVRNVHLRYEDHITNPQRGFAVGVTLQELSLHTTPAQTMSAVYQRLIHKVLTVRNLALYWTADPPVQYTSVSEMIHVMDQFIARGNQATSARPLQYVLAPVTCHVQLQVNPSDHVTSATDVPKIDARIRLEPINLSLSEAQYSDAMCLLTALTNHATRVKHARLRPRMTPHSNPRAWWSYLATLLLSQVRARKHRWSSEYFTERRRQRLEYIKLYKRLLHKTLSLNGRARLDHLEVVLSYDDILLFRAWAELELKREGRAVVPRSGYVASVTSWAKSWFTRKSSGDEADDAETVESRVEITDEMRKEFLNTIDYQPNTATASRDQVPADWIDARVEFSMPLLSLTLSHVTGPVCAVALREFIVRMNHRARGVQLHAELGTVEATSLLLRDHVTPLIRMLDSAPLLSCHVESNHNDYDLTLLLTPLEVRVDKDILHALTGMLTRHHTPSIQHIEIAAKYQLKRIGRRTRRHVERQMKQSSTLTVRCDVDVALPRIVVAHGTEQGARCELTVSLGHIRAQHNEDTARTGNVTSANEFSVVWEDIHVNAVTAVNAQHAPHNHTVLQPVTVTADILLGTLASAAQARVKVRSSVSLLSMRVTPELVHQLLPLVQDLVPAPSLNESSDSVNGVVLEETVLQTDETILQLYDVVDADQSASEDEEELSDERAIDKSEYELIKTAECTLDLAGVEIQLRDDKSPRNLRLYLGSVVIGVLAREGELTANLLLREVRVSDGQHGDWLHTQGHPDWLTAHVRVIDSNSPRYNGVAHIVKLTLGTLTLCIVPPSVTNALNLVAAFTPPTAAPRDVPTVPAKASRASSSPSELSSKVLVHVSSVNIQALDDTRAAVTTVTLHDLTAQIDLKAEYQRVKGYIGNLRVMDCTDSDPRVVLTKSRDDMTWVDFNLIHLRNPRELANPLIRAHVKQLSVTAHLDYVTALLSYSAHLTAALPVVDQSRDVVSDTLPPAVSVPVKHKVPRHLPKYQIIVEAPELVVLVRNEQRHVIGQLVFTGGDLLLFNTSRWTEGQSRDLLDTINVTWTGCQLTYQPLLTDAGTQHVISNLAVVAAVERVYSRHVLTTPHLTVRCTVSPVIFAVNQQICDVFATLFSEWTKHQSRAPIAHINQSANANISRAAPVTEAAPSRAPVAESHVSVFVHLEELAVKLDGVNQCATTCAVQQVTARVTMDQDPRQSEVHTRVRAAVESVQIIAHQRHVEDLVLLGPASHVTVLGRRADHVIGHEPLMQIDLHQSQSALLTDHLQLRVKLMPLRAVCVIDTLTRLVNSVTPILDLTSALTPVTPSTPSESVTRVNPAPVSRAINTREIEVVVKELEVTVPENSEANNSSNVKVLSLKTDLVASVQLNATGTHVHSLLQHTDLALLDLLNKQGNFDIQRSQLLDPFELVVTAHLTPHESRAEVTAQPLLLRISFMDLVLFNQLATAFTTAPFIAQLQARATPPSAPRDTRTSTSTSASNSTELTVVLSNVQLTVIDDSLIGQTFSLPLIECSLNPVTLHLTLHGDTKATARVGVQCNFFNPQSMQWESLLHPLTAHLALAQHAQRTTAQCRIADPVALAVSQPLVQVASRAAEVLATLFSRQFQHTTRTPRSRGRAPALVLRNAVGRAIKWGHSSVVHELKDHSEVTLAQTGTHDTQLTLALQVTPFKPYHAVPVLTNRYSALHSALALTLSPHPKNTHRVKLLWEDWHDYAADLHYSLSRRGGMLTVDSETSSEAVTRDTSRMTRVKRLRTGIRIANGLPSSTAVGYTPAAVYLTSAKHGTVSRTLAPLADWPVPLDLLLQDDTRITVTLQHNLVNNAADLERRGRRRERGPVSVSEDSTVSDSEHEEDSSERYLDVDLEAEVDDEGSLSLWELLSVIQEARRQRAARDSAEDDESGVLALTPLTDPALRERSALIEPDEVDHVPVSVYISVPQCVLQLTAFSENNIAVVVQPHVIVENLLPALMWFKLRDARNHVELMEQCVNRGELVPIFCTSATMRQLQLSVKIEGYGWSTWATINNTRTPDQSLALLDDQQRTLHLALDYAVSGTRTVSVYSKYWLINRTGLPIQYRAAGSMHVTAGLQSMIDAPNTDPTLDPKLWYRTADRSHLNPLVLYSGLDPAQSKNRLHVQVSDSEWSQELNIDTVGWSGAIQLAQRTHQYALVSSIQLATPSKYFRTKVVTFAPRYVLVNHTGHVLYYRQEHTAHVYSLAPYEQLPFHPLDTPHSCKLSVTPRPDEWLWSGYFAVDKLGELSVNIRDSNNQIKKLMRVEVTVAHGTNFVTLRAESVHHPPYRIDNHSPESVLVYQKGHKHLAQQLTPYESQPYAWEQPSMPHVLVIELPRYSFTREIELDQIATHECSLLTLPTTALTAVATDTLNKSRDSSKARKSPLFNGVLTPTRSLSRSVSRARTQRTALKLRPVVTLEGPTRVLRLTDDDVHGVPDSRARTLLHNNNSTGNNTERQMPPSPPHSQSFELEVDMHSLGVSVVTLGPKELLYLSCQRIHLVVSATRLQQAVELLIDHFQVDNQLLNTDCPVVVSSLHSAPNTSAQHKPFAHISLVKSLLYTDLEYYHYCAVALQEVAVIVDETLLNELFSFISSFSRVFESDVLAQLTKSLYPLAPSTPVTSINNVNVNNTDHVTEEVVAEKKLYFEMLLINPIKLTLSFASGDPTLDGRPSLFSTVLRAAGVSLGNIDSASIIFNALALQNPFLTRNELVSYLAQHYKALLLRQAYKLFGALEVLGSPLSLIRHIGTGVYDFFYEPAQSLVTNPKDFVKAMAKGTSSLVTKSLFGLLHSLSNISGSLSKATATLTMDKAYVRTAQTSRTPRTNYAPRDLPAHLHRANQSRGPAAVSRTSHVLNELTSGMMSVIFKPITVLLHLLHKSSTQLRNSVAVVMRDLQHGGVIMRCRPSKLGNPSTQQWHRPRHQPTLEQYRYDLMSLVLISTERGAYKDHLYHQHWLLHHAVKKRNKTGQWVKKSTYKLLYIFSDRALFCITPDHHLRLNWLVYYTDIHALRLDSNQLVIVVKQQWQEYTVHAKKGAYEILEPSSDGFRRIVIDFVEDLPALLPFKSTTEALVKTTRDNMRDY